MPEEGLFLCLQSVTSSLGKIDLPIGGDRTSHTSKPSARINSSALLFSTTPGFIR